MDERLQIFQDKMEKSLANLNEEFAGIRAGRANPHVLDKLRVDYYGTPSPIQSVANVSVPEPRMIQIQPWEASMVKEIERAGIPVVHVCTVTPISMTVGANRIVPAIAIPHPLGNPALDKDEEKALRRRIVEKALNALTTEVDGQTIFE